MPKRRACLVQHQEPNRLEHVCETGNATSFPHLPSGNSLWMDRAWQSHYPDMLARLRRKPASKHFEITLFRTCMRSEPVLQLNPNAQSPKPFPDIGRATCPPMNIGSQCPVQGCFIPGPFLSKGVVDRSVEIPLRVTVIWPKKASSATRREASGCPCAPHR